MIVARVVTQADAAWLARKSGTANQRNWMSVDVLIRSFMRWRILVDSLMILTVMPLMKIIAHRRIPTITAVHAEQVI